MPILSTGTLSKKRVSARWAVKQPIIVRMNDGDDTVDDDGDAADDDDDVKGGRGAV